MKKLFSLIKVSLNHDMNLFKINSKKSSKAAKIIVPIVITVYLMFVMGVYSEIVIKSLEPMHLEYIVLTLFGLVVTIITLLEGVYKSGPLLFNCKDDNLLLSLPLKKSTVLFIRMFKFYIFELLYNSLFLLPSIIIYAVHTNPSWTYYLVSLIALLMLPIIPIILSCIIGFIITFLSSKVKGKNLFQTIFSLALILFIMFLSYGMDGFILNIASKASSINDVIIRFYYPIGAYISLVTNFDIMTLLIFIGIHILVFGLTIYILSICYFKINSGFKKEITNNKKKGHYIIKSKNKFSALIYKELNRIFTTPVLIINAGFGLVLYLIACIVSTIKFDEIANTIASNSPNITLDMINGWLPMIMFCLVCFSSLMTSITSSMISLEGKSINILKSLPIEPIEIVINKVITAVCIMLPCIILGDIIIFIRFKFDIISIILILLASVTLPLVTELFGIIINLKYPKMDATNDTEIVKQSMSSAIAVFAGMGLLGLTVVLLLALLYVGLSVHLVILLMVILYALICFGLWKYLNKNCNRDFNNINI